MLVVRQRRGPVSTPSIHQVPGVGPTAQASVEKIGKACEWKRPRTPSVRLRWEVKATEAVSELFRTTRVGCIGARRVPPENIGEDSKGEKGGPGLP